jgi:hypothetical protein
MFDEVRRNLLVHVIADLERIAEVDAASDAHLFVLLGKLRHGGERPRPLRVQAIGRRQGCGRLRAKHYFQDADRYPRHDGRLRRVFRCIGAAFKGVQLGSRSVASLLSLSPLRIAVIGRQKL